MRQAEDRAHRRGQRRSVNVYFLIARGTLDERRSAWKLAQGGVHLHVWEGLQEAFIDFKMRRLLHANEDDQEMPRVCVQPPVPAIWGVTMSNKLLKHA